RPPAGWLAFPSPPVVALACDGGLIQTSAGARVVVPSHEPLEVSGVGQVERLLAATNDLLCATEVDIAWRQKGDAAVVVLVVVPGGRTTGRTPARRRAHRSGKARMILEGCGTGSRKTDDIAAEYVENDIQVEVDPFLECPTGTLDLESALSA